MKSTHKRLVLRITWPMIVSLPLTPYCLRAAEIPVGGAVTVGSATINNQGPDSVVVRQTSQRAVLRWESFSTDRNGSIQFQQPNAGSATLNIVTGNSASILAGSLTANGSVVLINQNGIAITPTGLVDTRAGFIGSSLGISDADFMAGTLRFSGKGGVVANSGLIQTGEGGFVGLLGSSVLNGGQIRAPMGKVALGAGEAATLDLNGDGYLQVLLPTDAAGSGLAENSGGIAADGGSVVMKASAVRDAIRGVVNMPGEIQARSVSGSNGSVVLEASSVQVGGKIDVAGTAAGANGGQVDIGGDAVTLAGATIGAAGVERGGLVRVGGDYQGGRVQAAGDADAHLFAGRFGALAPVRNADTTAIDAATTIDVSASGAQGVGGSAIVWSQRATSMLGAIDARGGLRGGALELSSKGKLSGFASDKIALGAGGSLLLDPKIIEINRDGFYRQTDTEDDFHDLPGTTYLKAADITGMLSSGVNVKLQASEDVHWINNFSFVNRLPNGAPGGKLNLSAGREVLLSGVFNTGGGDWSITANDTAANGVVDADRGEGYGYIDLRRATFIESQGDANGALSLLVADGAGIANRLGGGILMSSYRGASDFTAAIAPGGGDADYTPAISLQGDIAVAGAIRLTGNLEARSQDYVRMTTLKGRSVTWTDEKTGATVDGNFAIRFIENGVLTRLGEFNSWSSANDSVRLMLGDAGAAAVKRVYGDADPTFAALGSAQLQVAPHSTVDVGDDLGAILTPGSLAVAGPGVRAAAGASTLSIVPTSALAMNNRLETSYFLDLTPASVPMTITPRPLAWTVNNASYTYGAPAPVLRLNQVNGDILTPLATLNGSANTPLFANGAGFGFAPTVRAGTSAFTLTGLAGAAANNYTLNLAGPASGTLDIARKALTYVAPNGGKVYGDAGSLSGAVLSGVVGSDEVLGRIGIERGGLGYAMGTRLPAGTYATVVAGLDGAGAANYSIAASGNQNGTYDVAKKAVTAFATSGASTYGTPALLAPGQVGGIVSGDEVAGVMGLADGTAFGERTPAGAHATAVIGFSGIDGGNYMLAPGGSTNGVLSVARKAIGFANAPASQVYGQAGINTTIALGGVVAGDQVRAASLDQVAISAGQAGASGALPVGNYRATATALTGADSANYAVDPTIGVAVSITPKLITFHQSAHLQSTYGTALDIPQARLDGIVNGDLIGSVAGVGSYGQTPAGAKTPAGSYQLGVAALSGAGAGNYVFYADPYFSSYGSLTVARKPLTWQVGASSIVYADPLNNPVQFAGLVAGDDVQPNLYAQFGGNNTRPDVGQGLVGVGSLSGASAANYALGVTGNTPGLLTVTPRPVWYSVTGGNSEYGKLFQPSYLTLDGYRSYDGSLGAVQYGVSVGGVRLPLSARSPAGTHALEVIGFGNRNYMPAPSGNGNGILTIAPRPITIYSTETGSTYGTQARLSPSVAMNVLSGDQVIPGKTVLSSTGQAPTGRENAGSYTIGPADGFHPGGRDAANYVVTAVATNLLFVQPKEINYSIDALYWNGTLLNNSVTYGDLHPLSVNGELRTGFETAYGNGPRATLTGVLDGDEVRLNVRNSFMTTSSSGNYAAGTITFHGIPSGAPGSNLAGASAGNYVVAASGNRDALLWIMPKTVDVQAYATSAKGGMNAGEYGTGASAKAAVSSLLVNPTTGRADSVFARATFDYTATPELGQQNVGDYRVTADRPIGTDAANYQFRLLDAVYKVTPRPVWMDQADISATYGQLPTAWLSNLLGKDEVRPVLQLCGANCTSLLPTPARLPAGKYLVHESGLTGPAAANYQLVDGPAGVPAAGRNLTVFRAPLAISGGWEGMDRIYGDPITPASLAYTGLLDGDDLGLYVQTQPLIMTELIPFTDARGQLRDKGTYVYRIAADGRDSANYLLPNDAGLMRTLRISARGVVPLVQDSSVTYGAAGRPKVVFTNAVAGQDLGFTFETRNAAGIVPYAGNTDVGVYSARVTGLSGLTSQNYYLAAPGKGANLTIAPKTVVFEKRDVTGTYGSPAQIGILNGVMFGDEVRFTGLVDGLPSQMLTGADAALLAARRIDVGTHTWKVDPTAPLSGPKAANYLLAGDAASGSVGIVPKPINYLVDNAKGQYGNYRACETNCNPWTPGIELGKARFTGVLDGDTVNGTVGLLDLKGRAGTVDSTTPVGLYFEIVTGLTGSSAGNYRLADSGSAPGILEILPLWIKANPSSSIYLPSTGVLGEIGQTSFAGPTGPGLLNGDSVGGAVRIYDKNMEQVSTPRDAGRYYFETIALTGKDAGNYRILPYDEAPRYLTQGSERGTLDVYGGTTFGLGLVDVAQLPQVPKIVPPAPTEAAPVPKFTEFGRDITSNETGTHINGGSSADLARIISADATAQGAAEASKDLGGATMSGQASGALKALASAGVNGVAVQTDAQGHLDVTFTIGPGYVMAGLGAKAGTTVGFGPTGVELSASVIVSANAGGGISGKVGDGIGSVNGNASVFAYATSESAFTLKDGKLKLGTEHTAGTGASAGAAGRYEGNGGSVDAGVTVYTPGVVSGGVGVTAGLSGETLTLGFNLSAALGFGGVSLNFGADLNLKDAADSIGGFFSGSMFKSSQQARDTSLDGLTREAREMTLADRMTDAGELYALLKNGSLVSDTSTNYYPIFLKKRAEYANFVTNFEKLAQAFDSAVKSQETFQTRMLELLRTDPAAAIAYSHKNLAMVKAKEQKLADLEARAGVHMVVENNKLAYKVNP